eukprot:5194284-Amphidinium_carterae.1
MESWRHTLQTQNAATVLCTHLMWKTGSAECEHHRTSRPMQDRSPIDKALAHRSDCSLSVKGHAAGEEGLAECPACQPGTVAEGIASTSCDECAQGYAQ